MIYVLVSYVLCLITSKNKDLNVIHDILISKKILLISPQLFSTLIHVGGRPVWIINSYN